MKEVVKASVVQFAPRWLAPEHNAERMKALAQKEAQSGADLVLFPELANLGYITPAIPGKPPAFDANVSAAEFAARYVSTAEPVPGPTTDLLQEVCQQYGAHIVVGLAESHPVVRGMVFNSCALIGPQGVVGVHRKVHLPQNEKLYFCPGDSIDVYPTDLGTIGLSVCYDGRFPELSRVLALKGAEIICSVWAIPRSNMDMLGEAETLKFRAYTRAQENGLYYLACSRTGQEGDTSYLGHSAVAAPTGKILAFCESDQEEVLRVELAHERLVKYRAFMGIFRDRRPDLYSSIVEPLSWQYRPPRRLPLGEGRDLGPDMQLRAEGGEHGLARRAE